MKEEQIKIRISTKLKQAFKKRCNEEDRNMTKVLIRLIKEYLEGK